MIPLLCRPGNRKLLLDKFPGATTAYSLRKLRKAYSGACIRVRRTNDNAELDVGFSGNNLDINTLLSFIGNNSGVIITWYDQSESGNNATQAISSRQPRIVNSGVIETKNNRQSIFFDGSDDYLSASAGFSFGTNFITFAPANTINYLSTVSTSIAYGTTSFDALNLGSWTGTFADELISWGQQSPQGRTAYRSMIDSLAAGNLLTLSSRFTGGFWELFRNNNQLSASSSGSFSSPSNTSLHLAANSAGGNRLNGHISECIVYPSLVDLPSITSNIIQHYSTN